MRQSCWISPLLLLGLVEATPGQDKRPPEPAGPATIAIDKVTTSNGPWTRISGRAEVVNAYTLRLGGGTEVDLRFAIDAPELDQKSLVGDRLYLCGREAAEFLARLIGGQPVVLFTDEEVVPGRRLRGPCFVGEMHVQVELVRHGWAVSAHSGMDAWEVIAREGKRGLWRGRFVPPKDWRRGHRLLAEGPARAEDPAVVRQALAALRDLEPTVRVDETLPGKPVVAMHFLPNFGRVTDDHLAHLRAFPHLRSVAIPNKPFVTDAGIVHLADLDQLEDVVLNGTAVTAEAAVRLLKGRTRMLRLSLMNVPLGDDDLAALGHLTELRDLSLRGTRVTDRGAERLKAFAKLRSLNLATRDARITDAALPHLKNLADLEYLDLDRTGITDAGLEHLKGLRHLRGVQFAFTWVTDRGLEHLHALPNLEEVNARGTGVSQAGVDRLKRLRKNIRVGFGPAIK
jgi:endonuclease YncB( thermonuclease family)